MVAATLPDRIRHHEPVRVPHEERADLAKLSRELHRAMQLDEPRCSLIGPQGERFAIPESIFYLLARVAEVLERGDAISLIPVHQELTTQQSADLLNVSRQYLVRLLDDGQIPYTRTGKHRRLRIDDVMAYKQKRDKERNERFDELIRMSEEYGGYDEPER